MSLYKKPGSKYWWAGFKYRGRRYQFSTRIANRNDAAEVERSYRTNLSKGEVGLVAKIEGPGLSVGELLDRLKADYELQGKGSVQNLSHLARAKKDFGAKRSDGLTADDIKSYQRRRVEAGSANGTVNRVLQLVLRAYSLENETRGKNNPPLPPLNPPMISLLDEKANVRQGFFSREEFDKVASFLPEDLRDFCLFGFLTGMRSGEIKSLSWSSVSENSIRLRGIDAKTRKPRTIVAAGELAELLERRRQLRGVKTSTGVVMASTIFHREGKPIGEFRKSWQTACIAAGLGSVSCPKCGREGTEKRCPHCKTARKYRGRIFHDLRRSGVRNLIRAGVPQNIAMRISGHRTDSTFRRYDICSEDDLAQAMVSLEKYHKAEQQKIVSIAAAR